MPLVLLAWPASAAAHGIGEDAAGRTVLEYIPFGTEHMLLGWDHLLFAFGVVLIAGSVTRAVKLISLFVAGHSLTLIVASLAGWTVNATLVDVVIAASVVFVGVVGLRGQLDDWRWFGAAVFVFGLVHGLGLATRLQEAGLPDDDILLKVLAFNLGVEIGQILAVSAIVALGYLLTRESSKDMADVHRIAFVLVTVAGVIGIAVTSFPGPESEDDATIASAGSCDERPYEPGVVDLGAGHPTQTFYEPGDEVNDGDLNHVVGDGYLIVRYRADLSRSDVDALADWHRGESEFVIVAPDEAQNEATVAITRETELACDDVDINALADFSGTWFEAVGQV